MIPRKCGLCMVYVITFMQIYNFHSTDWESIAWKWHRAKFWKMFVYSETLPQQFQMIVRYGAKCPKKTAVSWSSISVWAGTITVNFQAAKRHGLISSVISLSREKRIKRIWDKKYEFIWQSCWVSIREVGRYYDGRAQVWEGQSNCDCL